MRQMKSLALPLGALIVVPIVIVAASGSTVFGINFFSPLLQVLIGLIACVAGIKLMSVTIRMLAELGEGTLAPWDPTSKLVTAGIYSHVRNPMITGVLTILLGESMFLGSLGIFIWALVFFAGNTVYFHYSEEKGLEQRFGEAYADYRRNVPMWLPRIKPWNPQG
ncbi:MAG: methyltransferase family protein [Candidatus Geothermincolia bacterium]